MKMNEIINGSGGLTVKESKKKTSLLIACIAGLFLMEHAHASVIVQPVGVTSTGTSGLLDGRPDHATAIASLINGSGFTPASVLDNGVTVPGTLPAHSTFTANGFRWFDGQVTTLDFALGGAMSGITSVILYNYSEANLYKDRGLHLVDVRISTNNGGSWSLWETDMEFAQASSPHTGQIVDFSSPLPSVTNIRFDNLRNFDGPNDGITGLGEVRFVAIPEPSTLALLGTGLGVLMAARRRKHTS